MSSMFCISCGTKNQQIANYCFQCGNKLQKEEKEEKEEKKDSSFIVTNNKDNDNDNEQKMKQSDQFETNWDKVVESFENMNLKEDLFRGICSYGFGKPSEVQQRGILPIIQKRDVMVQAQYDTGTDKIAAYGIAALQRLDLNEAQCQVLVLAPTRELAQQIHKVIKSLGAYLDVTTRACIGGTTVHEDIQQLANGVQIVVGTPGRVKDMISRGALRLKALKIFILDEADELLSRGFKEQIYYCFQYLPSEVQTVLVGTTMSNQTLQLTERFMRNPVRILLKKEELTLDSIKQYYVAVEKEDYKFATLYDLYGSLTIAQAIIYCNTRRTVLWLANKMKQNDFTVSAVYGDMYQKEKELIMEQFRSGSTRVLITTEILSQGVSRVYTLSLVINYDFPMNRENYVHRITKSARNDHDRNGKIQRYVAINFVCDGDKATLKDIETFYNIKIPEYQKNKI